LLSAFIAPAFSQGTINTIPQWNGTDAVAPFGISNNTTFGQTITVAPGSGKLYSWTIELTCNAATTFRGEVYAWNGTMATGAALLETAPMTFGPSVNNTTFTQVTFSIGGGLSLAPGTYVLFASTSKDPGSPSSCGWGITPTTAPYPGGNFVFLNNGTNSAAWTTNAWVSAPFDLAFAALFTGGTLTPVPDTVWLLPAGLLALGLWIRFRPGLRSGVRSRSSP